MFFSKRYIWILLGDALCLAFSFAWVTLWRRLDDLSWPLIREHMVLFGALVPLWLWVFHLCGFYEVRHLRKFPQALLVSGIFISFLLSGLTLYFISGVFKIPTPKTILLLASFLSGLLIYFWRERNVDIFGPIPLQKNPIAGAASSVFADNFLILDRRLLLDQSRDGYHETLRTASLKGIPVLTTSAFEAMQTGKVPLEEVEPVWLVERVLSPDFTRLFYRVAKRASDIAGVFAVLPLAVLLAVPIMSWIWIVLGSPVFYRQKRVGQGKREFTLWKFRTMASSGPGDPLLPGSLTQENDPRVPVSLRWIRRLHLDEIPQLFNILKGDMSWVGPRPEQAPVADALEEKIPYFWVRHVVPPGLTGWAQVNMGYAGNHEAARERFAFDLYYLANRSVILDVSILLRTLRNVLVADGR